MRQSAVDISTLSAKALGNSSAIGYAIKVGALQLYLPPSTGPLAVKAAASRPLGRTLAAATSGKKPSPIGAATPGVVEFYFPGDDLPHFRCPPGSRRAGRWTDRLGTDCNLGPARQVLARIGDRMQRVAFGEQARGDRPTLGRRWNDVGRRAYWRALQREHNLPRAQRDRIDAWRAERGIPNPREMYLNPDGTPFQGRPASQGVARPGAQRRRGVLRRWADVWDENDPENDRRPESLNPDLDPNDPPVVDPTVDPNAGLPAWMRDAADLIDEGISDNDRRPESLNPNLAPDEKPDPLDVIQDENGLPQWLRFNGESRLTRAVENARSRRRLENLRQKATRDRIRNERHIAAAEKRQANAKTEIGRRSAENIATLFRERNKELDHVIARIDERLADEFQREPLRGPDRPDAPDVADRPNIEFANTAQRPRRRPIDRTDRRPRTDRIADRTRETVEETPNVDTARPAARTTEAVDQISTARAARNQRRFVPDRYGPEFLDLQAGLDEAQQASIRNPDQTLVLLKGRDGKYRIADRRMDWDPAEHKVMAFYDAGVRKPISEHDIVDKIGEDYTTVEEAIDVAQEASRNLPDKRIVVVQGRDDKFRVVEDGLFSADRNDVVFSKEPYTPDAPETPPPPPLNEPSPDAPAIRTPSPTPVDSMAARALQDDQNIQQAIDAIDTWEDPATLPEHLRQMAKQQSEFITRRDAIEELLRQGLLPEEVRGDLGERPGDFRNRAAVQRYLERLDARIVAYDEIQDAGFRRLRELQARPPIATTSVEDDLVDTVVGSVDDPLTESDIARIIAAADGQLQPGTLRDQYRWYGAKFGRQMVERYNANIPDGLDPNDPAGERLDPNNLEHQMRAIAGYAVNELGVPYGGDMWGGYQRLWWFEEAPEIRSMEDIASDAANGITPPGRIAERRAWETIVAPELLARRRMQVRRDLDVLLIRKRYYEDLADRGDAYAVQEALKAKRAAQVAQDDLVILENLIVARRPVPAGDRAREEAWLEMTRDQLTETRDNIKFVIDEHTKALRSLDENVAMIERDFDPSDPQIADTLADFEAIRRHHEFEIAARTLDHAAVERILDERGPDDSAGIDEAVVGLKRQIEGVRLLAAGLMQANDAERATELLNRMERNLLLQKRRVDNDAMKDAIRSLQDDLQRIKNDVLGDRNFGRSDGSSERLREYKGIVDRHLGVDPATATEEQLAALDSDLKTFRTLAEMHGSQIEGFLNSETPDITDDDVLQARQYANVTQAIRSLEQKRIEIADAMDARGIEVALAQRDEGPAWLQDLGDDQLSALLSHLLPRSRDGLKQWLERPVAENFGGPNTLNQRVEAMGDLIQAADEEAWTGARLVHLRDQVLAEYRIRQRDRYDAEHRQQLDTLDAFNLPVVERKLSEVADDIERFEREIAKVEDQEQIRPDRQDYLWRANHRLQLARSLRDALVRRREVLQRQERDEQDRFLAASVIPDDPDFRPEDMPHLDLAELARSARDRYAEAVDRLETMRARNADQATLDRQQRVVTEAEHELAVAFMEQERRLYAGIADTGLGADYHRNVLLRELTMKIQKLKLDMPRERAAGNYQRVRDMQALLSMYEDQWTKLSAFRGVDHDLSNLGTIFGDEFRPNDWTPDTIHQVLSGMNFTRGQLLDEIRFGNPPPDFNDRYAQLMRDHELVLRRYLEAATDAIDGPDWTAGKEVQTLERLQGEIHSIQTGILNRGVQLVPGDRGLEVLPRIKWRGPADEYFYSDDTPVSPDDLAHIKRFEQVIDDYETLISDLNDQWLTRLADEQSQLVGQLRYNRPDRMDTQAAQDLAQRIEDGNMPDRPGQWAWGSVVADVLDGSATHRQALEEIRTAQMISEVVSHQLEANKIIRERQQRRDALHERLRSVTDDTERNLIQHALSAIEFDIERARARKAAAADRQAFLAEHPGWENDLERWINMHDQVAHVGITSLRNDVVNLERLMKSDPTQVDPAAVRERATAAYAAAEELQRVIEYADLIGVDVGTYIPGRRDDILQIGHDLEDLASRAELKMARLGGPARIAQRQRWLSEDDPAVVDQLLQETEDQIQASLDGGAQALVDELGSARLFENDADMQRRVTELETELVDHLALLEDRAALRARMRVLEQRRDQTPELDYSEVKTGLTGGVPLITTRPAELGLAGHLAPDGTIVIDPVVDPSRAGEVNPRPTPEEISEHVYYLQAGGDLAHIPDYALLRVLEDPRTNDRFQWFDVGGNQGDNRLYMPPDAPGRRGVFVKGEDARSQTYEMVGAMLSHAMGFGPLPPRVDGAGELERGRRYGEEGRYLVFEHILNHVDTDALRDPANIRMSDYYGYEVGQIVGLEGGFGLGQRIAAALQGFALDLGDRHPGNTMLVDLGDGRVVVLPVDFAWLRAGGSYGDLDRYMEDGWNVFGAEDIDPTNGYDLDRIVDKINDGTITAERGLEILRKIEQDTRAAWESIETFLQNWDSHRAHILDLWEQAGASAEELREVADALDEAGQVIDEQVSNWGTSDVLYYFGITKAIEEVRRNHGLP